jgi:hypothetical protein
MNRTQMKITGQHAGPLQGEHWRTFWYGSDANRARPSGKRKQRSGVMDVTNTYSRRSNLRSSMSIGRVMYLARFARDSSRQVTVQADPALRCKRRMIQPSKRRNGQYLCATHPREGGIFSGFRVRKIPCPHAPSLGLTMYVRAPLPAAAARCRASASTGRLNDSGWKSNSRGSASRRRFRCRASLHLCATCGWSPPAEVAAFWSIQRAGQLSAQEVSEWHARWLLYLLHSREVVDFLRTAKLHAPFLRDTYCEES